MMTKNNFLLFALFCFLSLPALAAPTIDYPFVELQALDKSTARTITLKAKVGETVQYGSLFIKVKACRKSEPLEKPESASFIQVWEVPINSDKSEWIFSGWMFASSPALSAMDHAVYDVWVLDCLMTAEKGSKKSPKIEAEVTAGIVKDESGDEVQDTENKEESAE